MEKNVMRLNFIKLEASGQHILLIRHIPKIGLCWITGDDLLDWQAISWGRTDGIDENVLWTLAFSTSWCDYMMIKWRVMIQ